MVEYSEIDREIESVEKVPVPVNVIEIPENKIAKNNKEENNSVSPKVSSPVSSKNNSSDKAGIAKNENPKSSEPEKEKAVDTKEPNPEVQSVLENTTLEEVKKVEAVVCKIPNAFSPNGDGENDIFKVTGENLEKIELFIFDKAGKIIYKIQTVEDEWNGKNQSGFDLPPGTYYVAGSVVDSSGNLKRIKQSIVLFK